MPQMTDWWMDRQTDRQTGWNLYMPQNFICGGIETLNSEKKNENGKSLKWWKKTWMKFVVRPWTRVYGEFWMGNTTIIKHWMVKQQSLVF